jgi:hypothetical protein
MLSKQRKAILSGIIAGVGTLTTALTDASVIAGEWAGAALATLVAYGAVYGVRNREEET